MVMKFESFVTNFETRMALEYSWLLESKLSGAEIFTIVVVELLIRFLMRGTNFLRRKSCNYTCRYTRVKSFVSINGSQNSVLILML